jgi:hypothetical protein
MSKQRYTGSITKAGIKGLLNELRNQVSRNSKGKLSSHDLRAFFQKECIHPKERYPAYYSDDAPDVAVTYTWNTCLLAEIPHFLVQIERRVASTELKYWIDIFFIDQNSKDVKTELIISEEVYRTSRYHVVLLANCPLQRGWCIYEIAIRAHQCQRSQGQHVKKSWFVIHPSISNLDEDLLLSQADVLGTMQTFEAEDRAVIRDKILDLFHSEALFNEQITACIQLGLSLYREQFPIDASFALRNRPLAPLEWTRSAASIGSFLSRTTLASLDDDALRSHHSRAPAHAYALASFRRRPGPAQPGPGPSDGPHSRMLPGSGGRLDLYLEAAATAGGTAAAAAAAAVGTPRRAASEEGTGKAEVRRRAGPGRAG